MLALTVSGRTTYLTDDESDDALRRFWTARTGGDATAQLIHLDDPLPEPPPPPPPAAPAARPVEDVPEDDEEDLPLVEVLPIAASSHPGEVSKLAAARIREQESWLDEAGFTLPPPIYAPGTRVVALGEENFRLERARLEEMPLFPRAAGQVIQRIQAEQREDVEVRLSDLVFAPEGTLQVGLEALGLELAAFTQLTGVGGFGMGARYLAEKCSPELRALNVTWQLQNARNRKIKLRTRIFGEHRQVFAVVTPTYAAVDTDDVLTTLLPALEDAHTEMLYDGVGVRATALFMPDQVLDLAAGDIFKAGVRIESDDTGRGRIRIRAVVWRNLCLNLIIIAEGSIETVSVVHRGDRERIVDLLREGVDNARKHIERFLVAWGYARKTRVNPIETLSFWISDKTLKVPGERDDRVLMETFLSSWQKEPGDSLADVVNAITRAAHEHDTWNQSVREELERRASELVFVYAKR